MDTFILSPLALSCAGLCGDFVTGLTDSLSLCLWVDIIYSCKNIIWNMLLFLKNMFGSISGLLTWPNDFRLNYKLQVLQLILRIYYGSWLFG